jgi:hypothetical protein
MEQPTLETKTLTPVKACGCTRQLSGDQVQFGPGLAGSISAQHKVEMQKAGAIVVKADQSVRVTDSIVATVVAGNDLTAANNLVQVVVAGNNVIADHCALGVVISKHVTLGEGNRILLDTPRAIAFGSALGAMFALVTWCLSKKRKRGKGIIE